MSDILAILMIIISRSTSKLSEIFSMEYKRISKCTTLTCSYITFVSTHW